MGTKEILIVGALMCITGIGLGVAGAAYMITKKLDKQMIERKEYVEGIFKDIKKMSKEA